MPHPKEERELSPEELEAQDAEALPDREVMTVLGEPPLGRMPAEFTTLPVPEQPEDAA